MRRESHVRSCESGRGRFPPATHLAEILHSLHYSLQANVKTTEGSQHPDRDAQFR